jgi:hypothetical protein
MPGGTEESHEKSPIRTAGLGAECEHGTSRIRNRCASLGCINCNSIGLRMFTFVSFYYVVSLHRLVLNKSV